MELKTVELTKRYGSKTAVDHLNITLTSGVYGLLGANGAGKTTLMRLLCAIQTPTSGKILLGGKNILALDQRYRNGLGYLPQQFGCYPDFTAMDFMLFMAAVKGLEDRHAERRSRELLEAVGLEHEAYHKVRTYSGGMRQRLGIAQAMLNDPRLLILDEPTAGLDPKERVRFRNLISDFARDRVVVLSTHIVSDVASIAGHILLMKAGRIILNGAPGQVAAGLRGKVWECVVPTERAERYAASLSVSNVRHLENGRTVLRCVSDRAPVASASAAEPDLEDLYLYYFREEQRA